MYYFIVNESGGSGRAKKIWHELRKELEKEKVAFKAVLTEEKGHASSLAEKVCRKKEEDLSLIVVGGDGTINEVLNGITDFEKIRFGVIPLGSGNDFAGGLWENLTPQDALQRILNSKEELRLDYGQILLPDGKERRFGISAGMGMDADVCRRVADSNMKKILNHLHLGKMIYLWTTLATIFSMKQIPVEVEIDGEWQAYENTIFLAGMNMPKEGGGIPMAPMATPTDQKLSLCLGQQVSGLKALAVLGKLRKGRHENSSHFVIRDFEKISVMSQEAMPVHADGEYLGMYQELKMEVCAKKLRLIV